MSTLPSYSQPDGLSPDVLREIAEIVNEPGYDAAVADFRQGVEDGSAYEGAVSTRADIEKRLGLPR